jgi:ATP-dependent RNA helicase RhlE
LAGSDVLGLAQTGTGKTAAFVLPILERLSARKGRGPRALILAPTRELALQIHAELGVLAKYTNVRSLTIFGGVGPRKQIDGLRARPDVLVACPGRLLDLLGQGHVELEAIEVLVLDEADHMFDMGFLPDVERILRALPARRQNLLYSATMPREIRGLCARVLQRPVTIELSHSAPAETVEHVLYPVAQNQKTELLCRLLQEQSFDSAIVFLRTKHRTRRLAQVLERAGFSAVALQGNMSQGQRERAMQGFRAGTFKVLVATDIAARGIDVAQVSLVINFDVPNTPDAYTHRIGRTGRAERSGEACTFVTPDDFPAIKEIERRLGEKIPRRKLRGFDTGIEDREAMHRAEGGRREVPRPVAAAGGRRPGGRSGAGRRPRGRRPRGRRGHRGRR